MRLQNYTILGALLLFAADGSAQTSPAPDSCATRMDLSSSMLSDARRALERTLMLITPPENSYLFRASSLRQRTCAPVGFLDRWQPAAQRGRFAVLPVQLSVTNQSAYPRTVND